MKNFFLLPVIALLMVILPYSCANDTMNEEPIQEAQLKEKTSNATYARTSFMSVTEYANQHVALTNKIYDILVENYKSDKNFVFDGDIISSFGTKDELLNYMQQIGIELEDRNEIVNSMEEDLILYNDLLENNSEFASLDLNEKKNAITQAISESPLLPSDNYGTEAQGKRTCNQQWDVDISRCKRNYAFETGLSVVGGILTGGVGGLLGFAAATGHWGFCLKDARDDYYDCMGY